MWRSKYERSNEAPARVEEPRPLTLQAVRDELRQHDAAVLSLVKQSREDSEGQWNLEHDE